MKVNEEKLIQAALDYVAALLAEKGLRVRNKSSQGMLIETDSATWQVQIEKGSPLLMCYPWRSDVYIFATKQALQEAVDGIDRGLAMDRSSATQKYIQAHKEYKWIFEITGDPVSRRLRLGSEVTDNSEMAIAVERLRHPDIDDALDLAEALVEMCNAFVARSVWEVCLFRTAKTSGNWKMVGKQQVYGISHLLTVIIELLTRSELLPPGHGLCGVPKVQLE